MPCGVTKEPLSCSEDYYYVVDAAHEMLELNPIPYKETLPYFNLIQKDIRSIANQFQEVITKKNIPIESGEEQVRISVDTVRRAQINAIPTE